MVDITNRDSSLSRTFSALKWFLALTVVADHFFRLKILNIDGNQYDLTSYTYLPEICGLIQSFLKNYAVPVFFFMSGYLMYLSGEFKWDKFVPKLKKRIKRLGIPFIVWSIFGMAVAYGVYVIHALNGAPDNLPYVENGKFEYVSFFRNLLGLHAFPEQNVPLWYLRDLIIMICLLPIVHIIIKKLDWRAFLTVALGMFLIFFKDHRGLRLEVGILFFYFGYFMRYNDIDIILLFKKVFPYAVALYVLLGLFYFFYYNEYNKLAILAKNINICISVPMFVYLFYTMVNRNWINGNMFLASASFFLYLTHYPLQEVFRDMMFSIFRPQHGSVGGTLTFIGAYLLMILSIVSIFYFMRRLFPRQMGFLLGTR